MEMEMRKIADLLRATIDPNQRASAEEQLKQVEKIIGVAPALLQIVMSQEVEMPVRQAGAIYLKNMMLKSWSEPDEDEPPGFHIHEQDRGMIRDALVDAVVHAPKIIRSQLCECVGYVCKCDFPSRWSSLVNKIVVYLQSPDAGGWTGSLSALRVFVKVFENKNGQERAPLYEAMNLILPLVQQRMVGLMADGSQPSLMMQRLVLKIFYTLTHHHLPLRILGVTGQWIRFQEWMEIVRQVLDRNNPEFEKKPKDEDDIVELENNEWWKTKKWAMRILYQMFERYGSPGGVRKKYKQFAQYFLNNYSQGALQVVFKTLDAYRRGDFVGEKVLRDGILYLKNAVGHDHAWKFMEQFTSTTLSDVIFPLMCHSDADERLWKDDPIEYIRANKYDADLEEDSTVCCVEKLLKAICIKRKEVLPKCIQLITQVLNEPNSTPQQKDGALHMVGTIADILLKKDEYKNAFDDFIIRFVFPSMDAPFAFIRARAAWLLSQLSSLKFAREGVLQECFRRLIKAILMEKELPVKVEAALSLEAFIQEDQNTSHVFVQQQIYALSVELLKILRLTEHDDLTSVLQTIVCAFIDDIVPVANGICTDLASTFSQIMQSSASVDDKYSMGMGLLNTMEILLEVMEEQADICLRVEPILLQVVTFILENSIMEFYEKAFSLIASFTTKQISPSMWQFFEILYHAIQRDGTGSFIAAMSTLHNYITVDTDAFLADQNRLIAVCSIIQKVLLDGNAGEDAESHAAKLMEVLILQCRNRIQNVIPSLLRLALERLNRPIKTSELRTMCLQVVIASLYHDLNLTTSVVSGGMDAFVKQWIHDTDCFLGLHDRKICVLGLCTLLQSPNKPTALQECSKEVMPSLILLFDGLERAYAAKAMENAYDSDEEEEEDDEEASSSDEDEESAEDLETQQKINSSENKAALPINAEVSEDDDDDDDDEEEEDFSNVQETPLECYATPLDDEESNVDEYIVFKEVLIHLQQREPDWYNMLTNALNEDQRKSIQKICSVADARKAQVEESEEQ